MKKNRYDQTIGSNVFNSLQRESKKTNGFRIFAEEKASNLVLESPQVADVFRQRGVLKKDEHHSKLITLFKTNLACQRYGVIEGGAEILTTEYASDRAKAILIYLQRTDSKLLSDLKSKGISIHKLYYALRDFVLKETLQTDFIAGTILKPETEVIAGIAVNKRLMASCKEYTAWLKLIDINPHDDTEMRDAVRESGFRGAVIDYYNNEPFYARRDSTIVAKRESITDNIEFTDIEADTAPLFGSKNGKTKEALAERAFVNFVETLGIDREKLAKVLLTQ